MMGFWELASVDTDVIRHCDSQTLQIGRTLPQAFVDRQIKKTQKYLARCCTKLNLPWRSSP